MLFRCRPFAGLVLLLALLAACSGRTPLGHDFPGPEAIPLADGWDDTVDSGDLLPDLPGDLLPQDVPEDGDATLPPDLLPDLPPAPCEGDADCPLTGNEPCFFAVCQWDDEAATGTCVAVEAAPCESPGPCQTAKCVPGEGCVPVAGPNDEPCDDGDPCTQEDRCLAGYCFGQPVLCNDDNPCTADLCNGDTGECLFLNVATPCDDGNACTAGDQCVDGSCAAGQPIDCNDFLACTVDACDPQVGCIHTPLPDCCEYDLQCQDGNECTIDLCQDNKCLYGPVDCDDNHPCTIDGCEAQVGCVHDKIPGCCLTDSDCDDNNLCTQESCVGQSCVYSPAFDCADTNPCTEDACDPVLGCVHLPIAECCLTAGDCDDADLCTNDWCAGNICQHSPITCQDNDPCTADSCSPAQGCLFAPVPDCCLTDQQCDDDDACTTDWCTNNTCQHKAILCVDNDPCTADSCDPTAGCLFPAIPGCCIDDSECADADPCTITACINNACTSSPVDCSDNNACTVDTCVPFLGCVYTPVTDPNCCNSDAECDDGDVCTLDKCVGNTCQHEQLQTPGCCLPDCAGKECGPDGCGGYCGYCPGELFCTADGQCDNVCVPDCTGKECGPDGCGTFCGICPDGTMCTDGGQCVACIPQCFGKECGPDGCGGSCGLCPIGEACDSVTGTCGGPCDCVGQACSKDGFEEGELNGWSFEGDAQVIHNMGVTEAPQGWYMAFVGSGLSDTELGKLQKTFCPPPDKHFFGFKWRLYSAEFVEWCGSIYQDRFIVTITNGNQTIELLDLAIDDLCPQESCPGCGDKYIGLEEADVEFDYPDVWMTPWSTAYFELPAGFTDTPITITFEVSDVGDMVYVTAILIDAIQFM